ncbi:glutamate-5-semialdehyde dehydrogenase [Limosilactobacillus fermentum]|uniref:glutamate-5-semialdehyde dehydrogenase n=1 Tax=Limosilactobacillus fermentum TaxID=1613 RepID=UPI000F5DE603|nr:glutamate-5-semialdehyde dehydrogenase [Limosilactobacillus fermentum]AZI18827.1 glutamate-5-semialdehyde dehydrogenase [Limosilactobacillus fermentum]
MTMMEEMGQRAKEASQVVAQLTTKQKNDALLKMATALRAGQATILAANEADLASAKEMPAKFVDRLRLTPQRIDDMATGLETVANLDDPVAKIDRGWVNYAGLEIIQRRVPLGVVGIIFEARPNVTADATALTLKSGNAVILRGGKEAARSNQAIVACLQAALTESGLPKDVVQLMEDQSHAIATEMMHLTGYIDVLIPRGGKGLIARVLETATVPVIETGAGNCHIYIDQSADLAVAAPIVVNAKVQCPSVCNAAEKLLVNQAVAEEQLPSLVAALREHGVEVCGDERARAIVSDLVPATDADWDTEYNDLIMAVKVVDDLDEAIQWINQHSTHHSESIITKDMERGRAFQQRVDSACVYVNASTRFTDGSEFGFGAEIGISTQKLHARGPMGLAQLTTIKYQITGDGQIRQ